MWLLFRGNLDQPVVQYSPSTATLYAKGFGKLLDFIETDAESWAAQWTDAIVIWLILNYYAGTLTSDWVEPGIVQLDLDSNDEAVNLVIRKLADTEHYIYYVDFNKALHYLNPSDDETWSGVMIYQGEDLKQITRKYKDEIVNFVTVVGNGFTGQDGDGTSIALYGQREKTFTDTNLTSQAAVDARATALLAQYRIPSSRYPSKSPRSSSSRRTTSSA